MRLDSNDGRGRLRLACAFGGALLLGASGCGGSRGGAGFASGGGYGASGSDDGGDASSDDASTPAVDSGLGGLALTSADAAPPGVKFDCLPGTYSGMFTVHVTTDAGLLPALVSFNVMGDLSITLVGQLMQGVGGEFPQSTLTIAPGAKLSGTDVSFGGHFSADLTGQLDCPSKTFAGTLSNGVYNYMGDAGGITMDGQMSATYDGTSMPPTLTMGVMDLTAPQLQLGSSGPWSATLK